LSKLQLNFTVAALVAVFVAMGFAPSLADSKSGLATTETAGTQVADAMANFGAPPSGEIPILFNDHHVYSKPDELKQNRVLAALVKNGVILVPLRSMFEQMGATVSWNAASKTATAQKPGASVQVTVGKSEAVINGETRPLDVPPEIYQGVVVVPVRVMSESLGAYVQWVPDRRICVVRYIPPTPIPTPPPTVAPTAPPTPAPTPTPVPIKPTPYLGFVDVSYATGKNSNEFSAGNTDKGGAYQAHGALLFNPFAIKVDYRQDQYDTNLTCNTFLNVFDPNYAVLCRTTFDLASPPIASSQPLTCFFTIDGGTDCARQFRARQNTLDGRLEYKVFDPHVYIAAAYMSDTNNYGYPRLNGFGFGLEKLPDFNSNSALSYYGSVFYYPSMSGNYTIPTANQFGIPAADAGSVFKQQFQITKYDAGLTYKFGQSATGLYILGGWSGDRWNVKTNAPINQSHGGFYAGLGIHF
jgi:Copper amine oxidase N-terminal domain